MSFHIFNGYKVSFFSSIILEIYFVYYLCENFVSFWLWINNNAVDFNLRNTVDFYVRIFGFSLEM